MPEKFLYDPAAWVAIKLFGAVMVLLTSFGLYEHNRITTQGKKIVEVDEKRQKKCMTKGQCDTNRDYLKDVLDKFHEGQAEIRKVVTEGQTETRKAITAGLDGVHSRVDKVLLIASQRRKGDD